MFYATRTTENGQKQLLAFSRKKHRDQYCSFQDGTEITAAQAKELMPVDLLLCVEGVNCTYTVQDVR